MLYFFLGYIVGFLSLVVIAFVDAKIKKKKIKKMMEQSINEARDVYGVDITKFMKGDK